jgi:hypothetical protein
MDIQFTKQDDLWVAEFEVTSNFNLHIERDTEGRLDIYQKTAGTKPAYIHGTGFLDNYLVYDNDFSGFVYPKTIVIKSAVKPSVAVLTTNG